MTGYVKYALPDGVGTLTFTVPIDWKGARPEEADAAWIDPDPAGGVARNVVLKTRAMPLTEDVAGLLDAYVADSLRAAGVDQSSPVLKSDDRRAFVVKSNIDGFALTQNQVVIHKPHGDQSYLVSLTGTSASEEPTVDLSSVEIVD